MTNIPMPDVSCDSQLIDTCSTSTSGCCNTPTKVEYVAQDITVPDTCFVLLESQEAIQNIIPELPVVAQQSPTCTISR